MNTLIDLIQEKTNLLSDQIAIIHINDDLELIEQITFGELDKKIKNVAAYLQTNQLGFQRILLSSPTGIEFICYFLGCLFAGAIPIALEYPSKSEIKKRNRFIESIAQDAKASALLSPIEQQELLSNIIEKRLCVTDIQKNTAPYSLVEIKNENIAFLQYTSGSTATPKAAVIRHQNLIHNIKSTAKAWNYSKNSITLSWAPHTHVYGLICGLLLPLSQGSKTILMSPSSIIKKPINWLKAISQYQVTHSGGPNFVYDLCIHEMKEWDQLDLSSWVVAINGGEKVSPQTLLRFSQKFNKVGFQFNHFVSAYGMSELSGTIATTKYKKGPQECSEKNAVSSGHLIKGTHAVIVDPVTLKPQSEGEIGEILLASQSLVTEYWNRPDETALAFNIRIKNSKKNYFRTGDLGFIKNNELHITGRNKDSIVIFGKKYFPQDIEEIARQSGQQMNPGKICVFSTLKKNKEEIVLIQEIKWDQKKEFLDKLQSLYRKAIWEHFKLSVDEIVFVDEGTLPTTSSGKLQRNLCKEYFEKNQLLRLSFDTKITSSEFIETIASILKLNSKEISLDSPFSQLKLDSITAIQWIDKLNTHFQLNLTPDLLFNFMTLREFYDWISNNSKKEFQQEKISAKPNYQDIAIIGMDGIFPGAPTLEIFWNNLTVGRNVISEIPPERWDWHLNSEEHYPGARWGAFIDNVDQFDANFFNISRREAELTDPQQRIFLEVVWKTIENAGLSPEALSSVKTGLYVGVFNHDYAELLQRHDIVDAYVTTGITHSILANRVSYLLNLQGPSEAIDTACSSSLVAIHHAVQAIQNGDCDLAIAGGVNLMLTPSVFIAASKASMLSPDGLCKTFDKDANGYVRAEGAAAILLKPLEKALADNNPIHGVIKGSAVNHGGHVSSLTVPNPNAQADVIVEACRRARLSFNELSYIETHGTGTALGDPIEINGIKKAYKLLHPHSAESLQRCKLGSVKTQIGHLEAAAGIAAIIKVLLSLQNETIPANQNFKEQNPLIDLSDTPFELLNQSTVWPKQYDENGHLIPRHAGISSFGYGGTNAHLILQEGPKTIFEIEEEKQTVLLTFSAKTKTSLNTKILEMHDWLITQKQPVSLTRLSYTLNVGRAHFPHRCFCVVSSIEELLITLEKMINQEKVDNIAFNSNVQNDHPHLEHLFNLLTQSFSNGNISRTDLLALGSLYLEGYPFNWNILYNKKQFPPYFLPTYPFEKMSYWVPHQNEREVTKLIEKKAESNFAYFRNQFLKVVSSIVKIDENEINDLISLNDLGFDSIALNELALDIESLYKIEFNPSLFFHYNSLQSLIDYLFNAVYSEATVSAPSIKTLRSDKRNEPIAVIGMSGYFPQSQSLTEFWQSLENEQDLITDIPSSRWTWRDYFDEKPNPQKSISKWGGFIQDVDQFDASFFNISAPEANLMDPQHRLFLEIVWKTVEDAGYDPFMLAEKKPGVFVGVEFNEYQNLIKEHHHPLHGYIATGNSHAMLANRVSYFLNWSGPSESINTACSSSLVAIHRAMKALQLGECQIAIAGGVSLILDPETYVITSQLGVFSPDGRCKTFSKLANGYVKGEGVAAVLLKPLRDAEADGDFIYGIIKGSAVNHGGKSQSLTAPNAVAQTELIITAVKNANVDPNTITYIETHGTGTALGDPIEIEGLKDAFRSLQVNSESPFCAIGSVKTNIGHLEPASGIAGFIKVLLAMQNKKIPGTLHCTELNPNIHLNESPFYIAAHTTEWKNRIDQQGLTIPLRAGISSFGFGGVGAHVIVEEFISESFKKISAPYYLFTLSAKNEFSLKQKIKDLISWIERNENFDDLASLSYTLNKGRTHFKFACAMVVNSLVDLKNTLATLLKEEIIQNGFINIKGEQLHSSPALQEIYQSSINSIHLPSQSEKDYFQKLLILADLYTKKFTIDWNAFYRNQKFQRLPNLPNYPFQKSHYWFHLETVDEINNVTDLTVDYIKACFAEKLRIPKETISPSETYEVYGVDSLIGLEIINRLEKDLGTLSKTLLYEKNKIQDLANYLQAQCQSQLEKLFGKKVSQPKMQVVKTNRSAKASKEIAIIGLSGRFPGAQNMDEFWDNLVKGVDSITAIPTERWNYKDYPAQVGSELQFFNRGGFIPDVDKFDPLFFNISPKEAALMDPQERLFLEASWSSLEDAGYTRRRLENLTQHKVGVFVGVTFNFYPLFIANEWTQGNRYPLDIQTFSVANRVSYFLNLKGPSVVIDTACSSSLAAIHLAYESILREECMMAIAGGVNLSLHPAKFHFLGGYGFLSAEGKCASFGEGGTGYVPGEGVGSIILKPLDLALQDHDRIYGIIKSSTINHGGKTSGYTVPSPTAQSELIKEALQKSDINPRTISYIEAHGTGTSLGDPIEVRGLQEAFGSYTSEKQFCAIGSVKSNIGHLEAAAGISQVAKVLLQMKHETLVPSLHAEKLNPMIDFKNTPFYVQQALTKWDSKEHPRRAGISSFGAGGTNVHLIMEEFSKEKQPETQPLSLLFLLSAQSEERLIEYAKHYRHFLAKNKNASVAWLTELCYTSQVGRESMNARLAILFSSLEELSLKLEKFIVKENEQSILQNMNAHSKEFDDISTLLAQQNMNLLAKRWIEGATITWETLYGDSIPNYLSMPTYPFAKRTCWIGSLNIIHEENIPQETTKSVIEQGEVLTKVVSVLAKVLGLDESEIDIDSQFLNYGLDSIMGLNFVAALNELFGNLVSPMDLYRYPTVNTLANYITEHTKRNQSNETQHGTEQLESLSDEETIRLLELEIAELENI